MGPSGVSSQAGGMQGPAARGRAGVLPQEVLPAGCLSSSWLGAALQLEWLRIEAVRAGSPPPGQDWALKPGTYLRACCRARVSASALLS